jgi:hypothetical protein
VDEIIKDQLDAVRYQKLMGRSSLLERPVSGSELPVSSRTYTDDSGKGSPAWLPNNEYEDDSYITPAMLEELQPRYEDEEL